MTGHVRVGGAIVPAVAARRFTVRYLNSPAERWSYPAYDRYPGGATGLLSEQDLLAPILLNVQHLSLESYYGLLDALPDLNAILDRIPSDVPLESAALPTLGLVADLFGVLDGHQLPGVRLTTLSKILHRKRPSLIPLYDGHIRRCYQELGDAPVPPVRGRSWTDFAAAWLPVVQQDLGEQLPFWLSLARLAPTAPITPLRALDIVGWRAGHPRRPPLG